MINFDQIITYYEEKKFIDLIIETGNIKIECHKLILSLRSTYFKIFFLKNSKSKIILSYDPNYCFPNIIDFFYFGKLNYNIKLLPSIISICSFYGINDLYQISLELLRKNTKITNILSITKELCDLGLINESKYNIPIISDQFPNSIILKIEDIMINLNPLLFKEILILYLKKIQNYFLIYELLEQYSNLHNNLLNEEKKIFNDLINFNDKFLFILTLKYNCNWMDISIYKKLIIQSIFERKKFLNNLNIDKNLYGRWYLFSLFNNLQFNPLDINSDVDIIWLISTLGGIINDFNPYYYGLINLYSSGSFNQSLTHESYFKPENIFIKDKYFIGVSNLKDLPYLIIDLGKNTYFQLTNFKIFNEIKRIESNLNFKIPNEYKILIGDDLDSLIDISELNEISGRLIKIFIKNRNEKLRIKSLSLFGKLY